MTKIQRDFVIIDDCDVRLDMSSVVKESKQKTVFTIGKGISILSTGTPIIGVEMECVVLECVERLELRAKISKLINYMTKQKIKKF